MGAVSDAEARKVPSYTICCELRRCRWSAAMVAETGEVLVSVGDVPTGDESRATPVEVKEGDAEVTEGDAEVPEGDAEEDECRRAAASLCWSSSSFCSSSARLGPPGRMGEHLQTSGSLHRLSTSAK